MKLYLSSYGFGNQPEVLFGMLGDNKHAAIIANSADHLPEEGITERVQQDQAYLEQHGITSERLDLRDYFDDHTKLAEDIKRFGLLWVRGANVFILRRAFAQSGLDTLLPKLLNETDIVYGDYSAGACIMGSTLHGFELVDDSAIVPEGYSPEIIWDGLNLVPYAIAPHYKSDHPESAMIDDAIVYFEEHHTIYKALRDGQAIVIDGDDEQIVG